MAFKKMSRTSYKAQGFKTRLAGLLGSGQRPAVKKIRWEETEETAHTDLWPPHAPHTNVHTDE